jgi:hypothetical protein
MANQANRLRPSQIQTDKDAFAALQAITGYAPANTAYTLAKITAAQASLASAQQAEAQALAAAAGARDDAVAREREFHDLMLGAKDQVIAQYGPNSNEAQALGRKKKSEYSRPTRRAKPSANQS